MIRIAHISDSHFDERGRLQDVIDVHHAFLQQARDARVDVILHAGDWFERRSTPAERLAVAAFLEEAAEVAPVFGVKGNHDAELDLSIFPKLETEGMVIIADRPSVLPGTWTPIALDTGITLGCMALPWFDKAHLVAGLEVAVSQEQSRQLTIATAQDLLVALGGVARELRQERVIPILVGHVLVAGSEVSSGQTLIGTTVELAPGDLLDVGASYVALGHVHKTQAWADGRVAYSGSPHRCNFGEPEAKGWRLVILDDDGTFVCNEFVALPAREMVLLEVDWTRLDRAPTMPVPDWERWRGALLRFRYRIRATDLHLVDEDAIRKHLAQGEPAEVKIEAVVEAETRARVPEIVHVPTTAEQVESYLRAKGIEVDDVQRERLRTKVGELEREAACA